MAVALFVGFVVGLWTLLWGSLTIANVAGGLAVAGIVLVILPDSVIGRPRPNFRPFAAIRLFGRILVDLVRSNVVVAKDSISPRSSILTGVIGVPMPHASDTVLTFVANVLALSPGILPIEVEDDPAIIYIHVLHAHDIETLRAQVQHLAALSIRAFGSAESIAALDRALERGDGCRTEESSR